MESIQLIDKKLMRRYFANISWFFFLSFFFFVCVCVFFFNVCAKINYDRVSI